MRGGPGDRGEGRDWAERKVSPLFTGWHRLWKMRGMVRKETEATIQPALARVWSELNNTHFWASLSAQWIRSHLPVEGTQVWSPVQEDPTCLGATKPVYLNYWAPGPQRLQPVPSLCSTTREAATARESLSKAMKTQCSQNSVHKS